MTGALRAHGQKVFSMKTFTWIKLFGYLIFWSLLGMFFAQNWRPTVIQLPFGPPYHVSMSLVIMVSVIFGFLIGAFVYRKVGHLLNQDHGDHDHDHAEDDLIEEEGHHG